VLTRGDVRTLVSSEMFYINWLEKAGDDDGLISHSHGGKMLPMPSSREAEMMLNMMMSK